MGDRERPGHNSREVDIKPSSPQVGQDHGIVTAQRDRRSTCREGPPRQLLPHGSLRLAWQCVGMLSCVDRLSGDGGSRSQPQQVTDGIDKVSPVKRVEMELTDALVYQVHHLFGCHRRR